MSAWTFVFWIALVVGFLVVVELLTEKSDVDELVDRKRDALRGRDA